MSASSFATAATTIAAAEVRAGPDAAATFSASADAYARTMAPSLRTMAAEVVRRAGLLPGERVLDVGTGTGIGAAAALGEDRDVVGLDAAEGMLAIARREVPQAEFVLASFDAMPFDDETFDVLLAVHCLLFAADPVAALREWRRVTRLGGRLSISVPGPAAHTPWSIYGEIYERYGLGTGRATDYPTAEELAEWVAQAGWTDVRTADDPTTAIRLPDEDGFRAWLRTGARGSATREWEPARLAAFAAELMSVTPREPGGGFAIPFGALYLSASRPRGQSTLRDG